MRLNINCEIVFKNLVESLKLKLRVRYVNSSNICYNRKNSVSDVYINFLYLSFFVYGKNDRSLNLFKG